MVAELLHMRQLVFNPSLINKEFSCGGAVEVDGITHGYGYLRNTQLQCRYPCQQGVLFDTDVM